MNYGNHPIDQFIKFVASENVTPAAGSVNAIVGAAGAELLELVCRHPRSADRPTEVLAQLEEIGDELRERRGHLLKLSRADKRSRRPPRGSEQPKRFDGSQADHGRTPNYSRAAFRGADRRPVRAETGNPECSTRWDNRRSSDTRDHPNFDKYRADEPRVHRRFHVQSGDGRTRDRDRIICREGMPKRN